MGLGKRRTFTTSEKPHRSSIRNCNFCGATRAITMPFDDRKAAAVDEALRCSNQTRVRLRVNFDGYAPPERPPYAEYLRLPASQPTNLRHSLNYPKNVLRRHDTGEPGCHPSPFPMPSAALSQNNKG